MALVERPDAPLVVVPYTGEEAICDMVQYPNCNNFATSYIGTEQDHDGDTWEYCCDECAKKATDEQEQTIRYESLEDLTYDELTRLIKQYNNYILEANDENRYEEGWRPVCVMEFANNDATDL